jgi:S-methylmethionine-dependent homocysteine/selenocysteine methylase
MYDLIEQKLARGATIILDGGTGTDIQRRGVPMAGETWCAEANLTHPDFVRAVHEDYVRAGAEIITANTFASSPLRFNALGRDGDVAAIDRAAVKIAKSAGGALVAGSFSTMRPVVPGSDRTDLSIDWSQAQAAELFKRKAGGLAEAGCDLILMEMMRDLDYSLWATEAAVATGLPVWVGIAVERREDGKLAGFGRNDWALEDIVSALMATGAKTCSIMHSSPNDTDEALKIAAERWSGPLGAYPESGYFKMPDWQFVDIIAPQELVARSRGWRKLGATILGGCCGIGPEHIAALSQAFGEDK